jgi:hypothetical protein
MPENQWQTKSSRQARRVMKMRSGGPEASAPLRSTRCEPGESTGDAKIRFLLVILRRELLRDNEMRPMSDWGSSGRRFKSCQPDRDSRRSKPYPCPVVGTKSVRAGGMDSNADSNPVHNPSRPARPSTAARAVSSLEVCREALFFTDARHSELMRARTAAEVSAAAG